MQISRETQLFIRKHRTDDVRTLALHARNYPETDMPVAIQQIVGWQISAVKIPSWNREDEIWYPRHQPLEQCSSESTARYKTGLLQGESLVDLTGGFGVDCAFLATRFKRVIYVERQQELCEIAMHNFPLLQLSHIEVRNEDGIDYLKAMSPVSCIFLDPARRNKHGDKTVAIADCEPDVAKLESLLVDKADRVMIKLSPMLDLSTVVKTMKHTQEIHIVAVNNECKELLLILSDSPIPEITIHCVNLSPKGNQYFTFTQEQEQFSKCSYTDAIEYYLYEPNVSLLKAGAYRCLSAAYSIKKLHPNSHLYTSDTLIERFPGRVFLVVDHCGFNKKEMKETLSGLQKANLTVRNFPATVVELRQRLKLSEGGDEYLFASTLNNGKKVLIRCKKM